MPRSEKVLNLSLVVDDLHVVECAQSLKSRLEKPQWEVLTALAAEIVAVQESAAAGQRVLVLTVTPEEQEVVLRGRPGTAVAGL